MDDSMNEFPHYRSDGFAHQRLCILPRPQVDAALARPATRRLVVTDAGYFPRARGHFRSRESGAPETIVILCAAGTGRVVVSGVEHAMSPGSCVTIPAGSPHSYRSSSTDPWTIWWLHARGSDVADLTALQPAHAQPVARLRSLDRVVALFDELLKTLEARPTPAHLLAASGIAWHLLSRIAADSALPVQGSALERAIRYLESRVDGTIQVGELAAMVGLSASHLSALFRDATGSGPAAFHTSLKMTHARGLLDTTSLSVAQVASAVGYADALYFSRHFRRIHGVSPSEYRSHHKG